MPASQLQSGYAPAGGGGGGGGGLTGFASTQNSSGVNLNVNTSQLIANAPSANADIVLSPKGYGAILAQVPDGTDVGGNKRNSYAVDLQTNRYSANEVASGAWSVVVGGRANKATGSWSFCGSGSSNSANNNYSFVGSGESNVTSNTYAIIVGGLANQASGSYGVILGGGYNKAAGTYGVTIGGYNNFTNVNCSYSVISGGNSNNSQNSYTFIGSGETNFTNGQYSSVVGGYNNIITGSGIYGFIGGGIYNTANGDHSGILGGKSNWTGGSAAYSSVLGGQGNKCTTTNSVSAGTYADAEIIGANVYASGRFVATGDAQFELLVLRGITTTNTQTVITTNGAAAGGSNQLRFSGAYMGVYAFEIMVTARRTDAQNECAAWYIRGCADYNLSASPNCQFVGTPQVSELGNDNAGVWAATVGINTTTNAIEVRVTGQTAKTIRWVATIRAVKLLDT